MTDRDHVTDVVAEYAVGALRGRAKARVEGHLKECASCRAELAAMERTGGLLDSVALEEAPEETWDAIHRRIAGQRETVVRRPRFAWGVAMGAVVLIVVVIAAWLLWPVAGGGPTMVVATEPDEEMQLTIGGHLSTVWAAPLSDEAAVGLRLMSLEDDG